MTELETLAIVWGISHFHTYLYGGDVTVLTDHSAVQSVLEAPNPTGKHARWWTRVYGRGIKSVTIVYQAGRENVNADALSRSPVSPLLHMALVKTKLRSQQSQQTQTGICPHCSRMHLPQMNKLTTPRNS